MSCALAKPTQTCSKCDRIQVRSYWVTCYNTYFFLGSIYKRWYLGSHLQASASSEIDLCPQVIFSQQHCNHRYLELEEYASIIGWYDGSTAFEQYRHLKDKCPPTFHNSMREDNAVAAVASMCAADCWFQTNRHVALPWWSTGLALSSLSHFCSYTSLLPSGPLSIPCTTTCIPCTTTWTYGLYLQGSMEPNPPSIVTFKAQIHLQSKYNMEVWGWQ